MKKIFAIIIVLVAAILAFGFDRAIAQKANESTFKGCSIIRRAFMSEAAAAFERSTGKKIRVMGGGATLGIRATAAGDADIGGSCRPALPELFLQERGVFMTHTAWDCLVFITHPSNPFESVSLEQAKAVLLGKITNWKEMGGPDKRIIAIFRSQVPEHGGKVSGVGFMTRLMLFENPNLDFKSDALFFKHSAEVEEMVEKLKYSFAVTGISSAKKREVKILALDGISPTKQNIASGKYPLFRPLYLMTKGDPAGDIKDFLSWMLGEEGQKVISEQGTVNLEEGKGLKEKFRFWRNTHIITNFSHH